MAQNGAESAQAVDADSVPVFTDNFNREDGPVGNGWVQQGDTANFAIVDQQMQRTKSTSGRNIIFRPIATEAMTDVYASVDIKYDVFPSGNFGGIMLRAQGESNSAGRYTFWLAAGRVFKVNYWNGSSHEIAASVSDGNMTIVGHTYRMSFSLVGTNPTTITATAYDLDTETEIYRWTGADSKGPQAEGTVGIYTDIVSPNGNSYMDNFVYTSTNEYIFQPDHETVKVGTPITYTVKGVGEVTLNDNGAGGTFSPATVDLGASYSTTTVTYTPTVAGAAAVKATFADETIESDIFASPYSTAIGFIGASIWTGTANAIVSNGLFGADFTVVKGAGAMNGLTSVEWANDYSQYGSGVPSGAPIMTNAINTFQANDVDLVAISIGYNDCNRGLSASYKTNLQTVIDRLRTAGIKHVLLYDLTWVLNANNAACVARLNDILLELATENGDFVLTGSDDLYEYVQNNPSVLGSDNVHPTAAGYAVLGQMVVDRLFDNIEYQITPDSKWASSDDEFTLGEDGTLTLSVDKYFGEFSGVVKVDDVELTANEDYTAGEGSTVIELLNTYLNTLGAGTYTLNVEFAGGVWVESTFTILADGTITPTPANPNAPAVPGLTSPNTGTNLGKLLKENRGAVLAGLAVVIAGLGISIVLIGRKLAKES